MEKLYAKSVYVVTLLEDTNLTIIASWCLSFSWDGNTFFRVSGTILHFGSRRKATLMRYQCLQLPGKPRIFSSNSSRSWEGTELGQLAYTGWRDISYYMKSTGRHSEEGGMVFFSLLLFSRQAGHWSGVGKQLLGHHLLYTLIYMYPLTIILFLFSL